MAVGGGDGSGARDRGGAAGPGGYRPAGAAVAIAEYLGFATAFAICDTTDRGVFRAARGRARSHAAELGGQRAGATARSVSSAAQSDRLFVRDAAGTEWRGESGMGEVCVSRAAGSAATRGGACVARNGSRARSG